MKEFIVVRRYDLLCYCLVTIFMLLDLSLGLFQCLHLHCLWFNGKKYYENLETIDLNLLIKPLV